MAYTGDPYEIVSELERLGEEKVRALLSTREFGDPGSLTRFVVEGWLSRMDAVRALSIARFANGIAIVAMIVSVGALALQLIQWWSSKP